jgi:hypothetical protein
MIIKHSTGKIDSVYDNKKEAEEKTKKEAGITEEEVEEPKKEKSKTDGNLHANN